MDQPDLDPSLHDAALTSLERLNAWARSARIVWPAIHRVARRTPDDPCRVLDIATGGGDLPLALNNLAAGMGVELKITAIDISRQAIAHAKRKADGIGDIVDFRRCDVFREEWPGKEYDVVMCSLFLHHLDDAQAVELLAKMYAAATQLVLVSDLRRCVRGLWLTRVAARTLSRSPVVRVDGPRSVRAAFTVEEVRSLAQQAGWSDSEVHPVWPFRLLLSGSKGSK